VRHSAESEDVIITNILGNDTESEVNIFTIIVRYGTEEEVIVTNIMRYGTEEETDIVTSIVR
jgi:hypothetical protein